LKRPQIIAPDCQVHTRPRVTSVLHQPGDSVEAARLSTRNDHPEPAIGVSEGVDFHVGELDAPLAQGPEGFERSLEKIRAWQTRG
jgi:hypothetical protein